MPEIVLLTRATRQSLQPEIPETFSITIIIPATITLG